MTSKSFIVMGEAPESESEEEIDSSKGVYAIRPKGEKSKAQVIVGEAAESDEDTCCDTGSVESVSSAVSVSSLPSLVGEKEKKSPKKHAKKSQSLLTKKLYERNASLLKNMADFVQQTTATGGQELNNTNMQLVKCQVQLQEASDILKTLNCNICTLDAKLQSLLQSSFVPDITLDQDNPSASVGSTQ